MVSTTAKSISTVKLLEMIFSACCRSPCPSAMAVRGAPPAPTSMANAFSSMRMGVNSPTPVSAAAPMPSMCPM